MALELEMFMTETAASASEYFLLKDKGEQFQIMRQNIVIKTSG